MQPTCMKYAGGILNTHLVLIMPGDNEKGMCRPLSIPLRYAPRISLLRDVVKQSECIIDLYNELRSQAMKKSVFLFPRKSGSNSTTLKV